MLAMKYFEILPVMYSYPSLFSVISLAISWAGVVPFAMHMSARLAADLLKLWTMLPYWETLVRWSAYILRYLTSAMSSADWHPIPRAQYLTYLSRSIPYFEIIRLRRSNRDFLPLYSVAAWTFWNFCLHFRARLANCR